MRLGLGNMASAGVSGITSGINIGASIANRTFGARTAVSVLVNALVLFLTIAVLFPVVEHLPRVVLSAVIMVIAVQHVDPWTLRHLGRLVAGKTDYRLRTATELAVVVLVAVLAITVDIVLAVFLGVAIAIVLFLVSMSRSIVRRTFRCDTFRSRRSRDPAQLAVLERDGGAIQVMELQGALFFGSAEKLANEVAAAEAQGIRYFVLDLRRVTEIDSTGSQILAEIDAGLAAKDKSLVLALAKQSETAVQLADFELLDPAAAGRTFRDVDRAIEWAEDHLLADRRHADSDAEIPLERFDILRGFSADDLETIGRHTTRAVYTAGQTIFREGERGRDLFLIAKGTASAHLHQADGGDVRLATFGPGTVFGELAILDEGVRSASVTADGELICHVLGATDFAALSREAPAVAIKLLANLGRELSGRLRRANTALRQLES
jgi:CRP-like cAMP-binding protein/anti-anti-sigma regulatory factor